jgi:ATP-dependent DNA helicase
MKRLNFLLEKSGAYATILGRKLAKQQEEAREKAAQLDAAGVTSATPETEVAVDTVRGKTRKSANKKRKPTDADYQLTDYLKEDVSLPSLLQSITRN